MLESAGTVEGAGTVHCTRRPACLRRLPSGEVAACALECWLRGATHRDQIKQHSRLLHLACVSGLAVALPRQRHARRVVAPQRRPVTARLHTSCDLV